MKTGKKAFNKSAPQGKKTPGPGSVDPFLLQVLACPVCKKSLVYQKKKEVLTCRHCRRTYAVRNGIPLMLIGK